MLEKNFVVLMYQEFYSSATCETIHEGDLSDVITNVYNFKIEAVDVDEESRIEICISMAKEDRM